MDPSVARLRPDIRQSVQWTQNQLDMGALKWLSSLPLLLEEENVAFVHGAFGPKPWVYCANEKSLAYNFDHQTRAVGFCGHSHVPLIGFRYEGGPPVIEYLRTMPLPKAEKVMVNVGSVGQPRDRDSRACCAVFDDEEHTVTLHRVPYDIEKTQELIIAAGLPERFATRLAVGR